MIKNVGIIKGNGLNMHERSFLHKIKKKRLQKLTGVTVIVKKITVKIIISDIKIYLPMVRVRGNNNSKEKNIKQIN